MVGNVAPDTVHVPSVEQPKSRPAIFTPAYVVFPPVLPVVVVEFETGALAVPLAAATATELTVDVALEMLVDPDDRADNVAVAAVRADEMADFLAQGILGKGGKQYDVSPKEEEESSKEGGSDRQ